MSKDKSQEWLDGQRLSLALVARHCGDLGNAVRSALQEPLSARPLTKQQRRTVLCARLICDGVTFSLSYGKRKEGRLQPMI